MSKLHKPRGPVGADTGAGELRKPHDYANQPEQGGAYTARETADGGDERPAARDPGGTPPEGGESSREYG
nr:hypothetical protein [Lysobacter sp.]